VRSLSTILDSTGRPFEKADQRVRAKMMGDMFGSVGDYLQALGMSRLPANVKARSPFESHVWVFAAGMAVAVSASQAPLLAFKETEKQREQRSRQAGVHWKGARAGINRRAQLRHCSQSTVKRLMSKAAEPFYEHPVMNLLGGRANPLQSGHQLMQTTHLWMAVRGECFWVKTMFDGSSPIGGEVPDQLWCLGPDMFKPIHEYGNGRGDLIGWEVSLPKYMQTTQYGTVKLPITDVIQFKLPNPSNPIRGMSRLTAAAMGIESDLLARHHTKNLLENGAVPKGIVMHDDYMDKVQEKEFTTRWEETYGGANKAGKMALLTGGFRYLPIQLGADELRLLEATEWQMGEVLACIGVPKTVLGVTDAVPYAVQQGQDFNFWDKNLLPLMRLEEAAIDDGLFGTETDDVFPMHDVRGIEALRAGLDSKITLADKMCSQYLHAPPTVAYAVVGLEVEEYAGNDTALVSSVLSTTASVLAAASEPIPSPEEKPAEAAAFHSSALRLRQLKAKAAARAAQFIKVQAPIESRYRRAYRQWLASERVDILKAFDSAAKGQKALVAKTIDLGLILPQLKAVQAKLKTNIAPSQVGALEIAFEFTSEDLGGIVNFELDDPRIVRYMQARTQHAVGATTAAPQRLLENLRQSVLEGINSGETVQQLRQRISSTFDIAESSPKTLQWARTESAGFMNGARDAMFDAAEVSTEVWSNSGDEVVRPDHVAFAVAGDQSRGFNYLEVVGKSGGILAHPGDMRCTLPAQIVNCRCLKVPGDR